MRIKSKNFWDTVFVKIVESLVSVKVLTILTLLIVSTKLLMVGLLDGQTWAMINGGVISTVYAMREAFKINKIKELSRNETANDIIEKIKE